MTKAELIAAMAERTKMSKKDAEASLNSMCDIITEALGNKDSVRLLGFGSFVVQLRQATTARNPKTGQSVDVPETWVPRFKAGTVLKDAVKNASQKS